MLSDMSPHWQWRYLSFEYFQPAYWQTVLCVWDRKKKISAPGYQGTERRRSLVVEQYRGWWLNPRYGAEYQGCFEIPPLGMANWNCPTKLEDEGYYLLFFDQDTELAPRDFFMYGQIFLARATYSYEGGFDWQVIPNHGKKDFVILPPAAPSRWMAIPTAEDILQSHQP